MFWVLISTAAVLYFLYTWMTMKPKNFPPGPPYLPIVGSTPFIARKHFHLTMDDLGKKYGPVVGLFTPDRTISVSDPSTVLEVLRREEFQGRPDSYLIRERNLNKRLGIAWNDGPDWVEQRRFTLRHLKEFGFGRTSMEQFVIEEFEELEKELENKTVQVSNLFNASVMNVLWSMMGGTRFKRGDPQLQKLLNTLNVLFRSGFFLRMTGIFSLLVDVFPNIFDPHGTRHMKQFEEFMKKVIDQHERVLDKEEPTDFIGVYLKEMKKQSGGRSSFSDDMLIATCLDLFSAGGESIGNTLSFAMLYMVLYPEVQEKVQKEIDRHLRRNQTPTLQDRSSLPYTEAVIMEIQRSNSIAPLTAPHRVTRDTELRGYFIPKHTLVLISVWSLLQDKCHWEDVNSFRPERFLDDSGKVIKDDWFIPFGLGKRVCAGEAFARNTLFLVFTSLMQKFTVTTPLGKSRPETFPLPGFTTAPKPFEVTFTPR
ncbi:methyl farnesoate epoxidase [Anabrus simplex]|uniref:methyl farnesoate epoxidase n=1 Tax=Anabrus simplex TaxID=316456 RepID=UPI0035A272F3